MHRRRIDDWHERAARTWDERAEWWNEMSTANASAPDRQTELDRWQQVLNIRPGSRLLDAGCGSGQFTIAWALRGCDVTGVDLSTEMLRRARSNASASRVSVRFLNVPITSIPDPDSSFDVLFCRTVLHLLPEPSLALGEFRRVLRTGGRMYTSIPGALSPIYSQTWRRHLSSEPRPVNDMLPWELEALLTETGWRIVDQWGDWSGQEPGWNDGAGDFARKSGNRRLQQSTATTWGFVAE